MWKSVISYQSIDIHYWKGQHIYLTNYDKDITTRIVYERIRNGLHHDHISYNFNAIAYERIRNWASSRSNPFMQYPCSYIALLNKSCHYKSGEPVGPVSAIANDYKVLELKHVVKVYRGKKSGRRGYLMKLLKKEVGELALEAIRKGDISHDGLG